HSPADGPRVPAEADNGDGRFAAAQRERLVAVPHVEVELAALDLGSGVHDGVDTIVAVVQAIDLDDGADRQYAGIGRGHARLYIGARRGRRALAVAGYRETEARAGTRAGGALRRLGRARRTPGIEGMTLVEGHQGHHADHGDER